MSRQTLLLLKVAEDEQAIANRLSKKFAVIDRNFVDNIDSGEGHSSAALLQVMLVYITVSSVSST